MPSPLPSPAERAAVAAFDVDHTLTTRDCLTPFLRRTVPVPLALALLRHPLALAGACLHRDRDRLKELACSALAGLDADELDRRGAAFAREIRGTLVRPDTLARLDRHRARGDAVVLVSASLEAYLRPLARLLGADDVLCTRLEVGSDGRLTGALAGENCRGAEKARRLAAWLEDSGFVGAELWAYGDSGGDRELLAMADHAVWVRGRTIGAEPAAGG